MKIVRISMILLMLVLFPHIYSFGQSKVVKSDFIANSFGGEYGAEQDKSNVAVDGSGNYAVTWVDKRSGKKEIYAQFYDSQDNPVGKNICVTDAPGDWNMDPAIAANNKGYFVIVWAHNSNKILGQRFKKDGQKIGQNFQINSMSGYNLNNPSVAVANNGYFLVYWDNQDASFRSTLYVSIFDQSGNSVTGDYIIGNQAGPGSSGSGWGSRTVADAQNNFVVVWTQNYNSRSNIYLQRIGFYGQIIGNSIAVSNSSDSTDYYSPTISVSDDGTYLIAWEYNQALGSRRAGVAARLFNSQGNFVSGQINLYESQQSSWHPCSASSDRKNSFFVAWRGDTSVYCQKVLTNGQLPGKATAISLNSDFKIYPVSPKISDAFNNRFYMTFNAYRGIDINSYLQKLSTDLFPADSLKKTNNDPGSAWQGNPVVELNDQGGYIILWEDLRNGRIDLYGQVYDSRNNPVGSNIQINDVADKNWYLKEKAVKALSDGTFVIAFTGVTDYSMSIYLQAISPLGEKIHKNVVAADGYFYNDEYKPVLNINKDDNILLAWYQANYGVGNAYMREFNKDLIPVSPKTPLIQYDYNSRIGKALISVSINKNLKVFASWVYYDLDKGKLNTKIWGAVYDGKGAAVSGEIILDSLVNVGSIYSAYLSNYLSDDNDKEYALSWRDGNGVHIKRFYFSGASFSFSDDLPASYDEFLKISAFKNRKLFLTYMWNNYVMGKKAITGCFFNDNNSSKHSSLIYQFDSSSVSDFENHYYNSAALLDDKLIFAYESCRNGVTGFDIWARVLELDNVNFKPEVFLKPVNNDILYPNVPNPFNSSTKISYQVFTYHKVRLAIYDILGREVKVLVDDFQEKGFYEINFDASGLASGIYLCRLEAFNSSVIKMILIK